MDSVKITKLFDWFRLREPSNMIKLFSLKQQKKDGEACPKTGPQKKATAAQLRITKGESLPTVMSLSAMRRLLHSCLLLKLRF